MKWIKRSVKKNLKDILRNADTKQVKQLSMPREKPTISPARRGRIEHMLSLGYSQSDIASMMDISVSTVQTIAKESR